MPESPAPPRPNGDHPFDLLLQDAVLLDGTPVDLGIRDGHIVALQMGLRGNAGQTLELGGRVIMPGLVEPHTHLDKSLTVGQAQNRSGTLLEAIDLIGKLQREFTRETVRKRALRTARMFIAAGVTAIRSHVDVTERINLIGVDALLDVREEMRGLIDIQLVTLATSLSNNPQGRALLHEALRMGVDVVGGAPALDGDPRQHIDFIFALAKQFGRPIDLHMDESDDPKDFWLPYLAEKTMAEGFQGRVVAGHCCALAAVDQETAARTIERVREARISVVTLPSANLYLQGRSDTGKIRRGITRVRELLEAGVPVCCGSDNVQDPFNPFGRGDLLLVANLLAHAAHLGSPTEQAAVLEAITIAPAAALQLPGYGLALDCAADLVVLDTLDPLTVLATVPARRYVIKGGAVVAETRTAHWVQTQAPAAAG
jgi:cytosine deaminase